MLNRNEVKKVIELLDDNDIDTAKSILNSRLIADEKKRNKAAVRKAKKLKYQLEGKQNADKNAIEASVKFREQLIENQTDAEKSTKALLKSMNINYEFQKIFYHKCKISGRTKFYIVDFYIPSSNIAIEIDGGYHKSGDQKSADKKRTIVLKNSGMKDVIRFTNDEVLKNIDYVRVSISTNKWILGNRSY